MKLITFLLLINFTNLQSHEAFDTDDKGLPFFSYSELKLNETTDLKSEKDLLISILIHSKWSDFNSIIKLSTADLRAILISELNIRTNENINILSSNTNIELSTFCLVYTFLKTAAIRTENKLQEMFLIDLRNTLIIENEKHLNKNINTLQALTTKKLVQLGYSWYLPKTYNNFINFNFSQRSTKPSRSKFKLKDDLRRRMNVIKIVKTNESCPHKYPYLGLYHVRVSEDNFNLQLAGSNDLFNWNFITEIDKNAHQGDIIKWNDGYLVAYEEDKIQGANNIALKYYTDYDSLISNHSTYDKHLNTSIHRFGVEGTPDIRNFSGESPTNGNIQIGFHYYDGTIDKLAMGVLQNGETWTTWKDTLSEINLRDMNFKGNIGSRKGFQYQDELLTLQEARLVKGDWSTWKIMLGLNGYYTEVLISTPKGSKSFANPSITEIDTNKYAISLFLPTEGNHFRENNGGVIFLNNK
ncbi:hypothetical protein N9H05_02620 [Flavobacteriaceae bacterium]|nr:hypothetical protein [Flavobacteriaceae bacterium]